MRRIAGRRVALLAAVSLVSSVLATGGLSSAATAAGVVAPASTLLTIPGSPLGDLVVDGADHGYVVNFSQNRVEVVKLSTRTLEAPIAVPQPTAVDLSPDGSTLYVGTANDVVAYDTTSRAEVRRHDVGFSVEDLAVASNGTALLMGIDWATQVRSFRQLDLTTGTVRDRTSVTTPLPRELRTNLLQASGDHTHILVFGPGYAMYTAATDSFSEPKAFGLGGTWAPGLDATGATVVADQRFGTLLLNGQLDVQATIARTHAKDDDSVAVDSAGTRAYRVSDDQVDVLDLGLGRRIATFSLPDVLPWFHPIALSADGATLVVPTATGIVLAPVGAAVPLPACTPGSPAPMVFRACGWLADVVVDAHGHAYASNPALDQIEVVSLATGALEASIPVGSQPYGLDLSADGSLLYVANWGASEVSVIDTALRTELRRIPIPMSTTTPFRDGPHAIAVAANGTALLTTSVDAKHGGWRLLQIDLASETVHARPDMFPNESEAGGPATVRASADRSVVAGTFRLGESSSRAMTYSSATDSFTPSSVVTGAGATGAAAGGTRVLAIPGATVFGADMAVQGTIPGGGKAVAVNASGTTGYRVQDGSIDVLDLGAFVQVGSIMLPEAVGSAPGTVAITPDSSKLAVLTASGLSIVDASSAAITPRSAYAVWAQPTSAALDAVGTWVVPTIVPAATGGQLAPSYLYAHYFNFTQSSAALGVIGLVTSGGTKLVAFGIVDGAGTPHSVGLPFDWAADHAYYLFVAQLNPTSFGGWVYDDTAGAWTFIGQVNLPVPLGKIAPATVTQVIWFGPTGATCGAFPAADAYFHPPVGYAGGGIALATKSDSGAGAAGACPATATTEVTPWIHLHLGASIA